VKIRRIAASILVGLVASSVLSGPAVAADPENPPVTLADGSILPTPPSPFGESIHAEMLAEDPDAPPLEEGAPPSVELALPDAGRMRDASVADPSGSLSSIGPGGSLPNGLRKEILGFLPYWMLDANSLSQLRYDLLSTIAYFGIAARSDGYLTKSGSTWTGWTSSALTGVINAAHARGVRVVPTVTFMAWNGNYGPMTTLLTHSAYRARLVGQIASIVKSRGADGVNIDFEPVPSSLRSYFTAFIRELKAGMIKAGARSYLTVDTMAGAATWATGYDVTALTASGAADALMVMAYDFSWSGSSRAGGVAPYDSQYIFDATDALADYLTEAPPSKLIWGVPYYGRTWPTQSSSLNSITCRNVSPDPCPDSKIDAPGYSYAYTYTGHKQQAAQYGRRWDALGAVPWYRWYDSVNTTWRQGYYDDPASLRVKYDLVGNNRLAGIGIWSLGMDTGTSDLWNVIQDRFVHKVTRIGGADRYAGAANLSAASFAPGVPVAYLATGQNFPDALALGPVAGRDGGPILLLTRDTIPSPTAAELSRLAPGRIVVLGGSGSVSDAVLAGLGAYTSGGVTRIGGADRYAGAANLSAASFPADGPATVYVVTGLNYPDGLSAGPVAARARGPILLVATDSLPAAVATELRRLNPSQVIIVGGTASVSSAVQNAIAALWN
jgi:spore germination protein YaaH